MEPILTFEAELCKAAPGQRLGIDIVLFTSEHGGGLVVERVHEGGQVEAWNRQSVDPRQIRPGDFIVRVNGVTGDVSALADEVRVGKDLVVTVQRPRAAAENKVSAPQDPEAWQMQSLACAGLQGMDPAATNRVMPLNSMQGMSGGVRPFGSCATGQQARRPGPGPNVSGLGGWGSPMGGADSAGCPLEDGMRQSLSMGNGITFEVILNKHASMRLGIDVLPSGWENGGVMVKRVAGSGAVAAWNQSHAEAMNIQTGDVIISANGVTANFDQMMEELRSSAELRLVVARGPGKPVGRPVQGQTGIMDITGTQSAGLDYPGQGDCMAGEGRGWRDDIDMRGCQGCPGMGLGVGMGGKGGGLEGQMSHSLVNRAGGYGPPAGEWQDKEVGGDDQMLWFTVKLEKAVGTRLGIVIKLIGDNLVVEQVPEGGCVADWNRRSRPPYRVQPGDFIVQVNGIRQWQSLHRMVEEFARECKQVTLTVQRGTSRGPGSFAPQIPGPPEEARMLAQRRAQAAAMRPDRANIPGGQCPQGLGGPMRPPLSQAMMGAEAGGAPYPNLANIPLPAVGGGPQSFPLGEGPPGVLPLGAGSGPLGKGFPCPQMLDASGLADMKQEDKRAGGDGMHMQGSTTRSPVNLLRSMLELNDQELGRVLRFMLDRRPWLREPVSKAIGRVEEDPSKLTLQ